MLLGAVTETTLSEPVRTNQRGLPWAMVRAYPTFGPPRAAITPLGCSALTQAISASGVLTGLKLGFRSKRIRFVAASPRRAARWASAWPASRAWSAAFLFAENSWCSMVVVHFRYCGLR